MRIVMLTDDVQIDRRIVCEAETLVGAGHEVILIASRDSRMPTHEWIGGIKVERIGWDVLSRRGIVVAHAQSLAIRALNKISRLMQGAFRRLVLLVDPLRAPLRRILRLDVISIYQRGLNFILRVLLRGITLSAVATNKLSAAATRCLEKTAPLHARERAVLDAVLFYRPDIVHAHDLPQLRAAVLARKRLGAKVIYDAHEFYPFQPRLTLRQRVRLRMLERRYIHAADRVVTVNPLLAKEMERHYPDVEIGVIENAVLPPPDFDPDEPHDLLRAELGLPRDSILLLYHGWIAPERNLETLVRGMRHVEDRRFVLVIMGYGEHAEVLRSLAVEAGSADRIAFVPGKPQSVLLRYVASADIGLVPYPHGRDPNTHFTSPNKLYEFAAAGLPILTNDLPFVRKVVEEEGIGVWEDLNDELGLARALRDFPLAELPVFRARIRARRSRFLWSSESRKLLDLYESLLPGAIAARAPETERAAPALDLTPSTPSWEAQHP